MKRFSSAREAKEFLVSKIVEEAEREGVSLSEVERKMLYFSETGWTLPDIAEVNDQFDQEYEQNEYEKKIEGLVKHAWKRASRKSREESSAWLAAVRVLKKGDHYIIVMVNHVRPPGDLIKLWVTGLAIVFVLTLVTFASIDYSIDFDKFIPSPDRFYFFVWSGALVVVLLYGLSRLVLGKKRMDKLFDRLLERIFR